MVNIDWNSIDFDSVDEDGFRLWLNVIVIMSGSVMIIILP